MTDDTHATSPKGNRCSRRLPNFVWRAMSVLAVPAMIVSSLVINLVAHRRIHARRRLLPHVLTRARHKLAFERMHQGRAGAELHARTTPALCADPDSHLAEADRILLKLRELGIDVRETNHQTSASRPAPVPCASELDV